MPKAPKARHSLAPTVKGRGRSEYESEPRRARHPTTDSGINCAKTIASHRVNSLATSRLQGACSGKRVQRSNFFQHSRGRRLCEGQDHGESGECRSRYQREGKSHFTSLWLPGVFIPDTITAEAPYQTAQWIISRSIGMKPEFTVTVDTKNQISIIQRDFDRDVKAPDGSYKLQFKSQREGLQPSVSLINRVNVSSVPPVVLSRLF
jgi:hypothetical protein